jgi:hypothetical protein
MNGMLSKSMELQFHARFQTEVSPYPRYNHSCQPYGSFGKQQRTILSGTTCVVRVQSGVRSTKMNLTRNTPLPPSIESDIEQLADGLDRCRTTYASAARHPAAASALYASCG